MFDDDFEPRLGKIRSLGSKRGRKHLHQILRAANLAGGRSRGGAFYGNRIGRGVGAGRVLATRDPFTGYRQRRVIIKSRIVKLGGKALQGARAHLRYVQRDGTTRDGASSRLYGPELDEVDGKAFLERSGQDRHQFRFIVSPEDGSDYHELKPLIRRLMSQMEEDLDTKLDWVAADHFNTGHPHAHVLLRGKDEHGKDLIIARDYMASGMRERAAELVQLDLGPRTDLEIERRLRQEVEQERLTSLDRQLVRLSIGTPLVRPSPADPFRQTLLCGRLGKLGRLGLAEEVAPAHWRLAPDLEATLRAMGERGDIVKAIHREMTAIGRAPADADLAVFDPSSADQRPVTGRFLVRGLSDELRDRHYLIIDGIDGRTHYVDVGDGDGVEPVPQGAVVQVERKPIEAQEIDRTIAAVAGANGGRYTVDLHLRHDPSAIEAFAEAHVRRLEAMRRLAGTPERLPDGTWIVGKDHLVRAAAFEERQAKRRPVTLQVLSTLPLEQQIGADGATWLDRDLASGAAQSPRHSGFGLEVEDARARRAQWLLDQGLATEAGGQVSFPSDLIERLRRRDLLRVAAQLRQQLGLPFSEAQAGERISGTFSRRLDLASGRFAVIQRSRDFTLVPWRPVLEQRLGKQVDGVVRPSGVSWSWGRTRGGPAI